MTTTAPPPATLTAIERARAAWKEASEAYDELVRDRRALEAQRDQLGLKLARDGKLTRAGRTELASIKRELAKAERECSKAFRKSEKTEDRFNLLAGREREREAARQRARDDKALAATKRKRERLEQRSRLKACYAALPKGAKPSQVVSQDTSRPQLGYALVVREGSGEKAKWFLVATDSYRLVKIPLTVTNPDALQNGAWVPREALVAIEKAGAFRITAKGAVQPLKASSYWGYRHDQQHYVHEASEAGGAYMALSAREAKRRGYRFPDHKQLIPKRPAKAKTVAVTVDTDLVAKTAKALGSGKVTLLIDTAKLRNREVITGIRVEPFQGAPEAFGTQMPIDRSRAV